jgi:hypothetical protein
LQPKAKLLIVSLCNHLNSNLMPQSPKPITYKYLRRYTHLPAAIHLLQTQQLTLVDPSNWDDKNDVFYMEEYKRRKNFKSLLALCLSGAEESYHYWKVFAGNPSGVCIRLHQRMLTNSLKRDQDLLVRDVDYRPITAARQKQLTVNDFPFVKRKAYIDEAEVRLVWKSISEERYAYAVPIPKGCIARVTLSPWLPEALFNSTRDLLCSIKGCSTIEVVRSTIVASEEWKSFARKAA